MIFDIWLKTACSSGFKWEKSSSGSLHSVSNSSTVLVKASPLLVVDRLLGSKMDVQSMLLVGLMGVGSMLLVESQVEEAFRQVLLGGDGPLAGGEDDVGHSPGIRVHVRVVSPNRDFKDVDDEEASATEVILEGETAGSE